MTDHLPLPEPAVGGGMKKVLYTLQKVRQIGVTKAAKALVSKNTCKACGLGMGGQLGGMTNELGEFPAVCNKSVQAQSTDIQPGIPDEVLAHSIEELKELDERELASLGRLTTPLFKTASDTRYRQLSWEEAISIAADRFRRYSPDRSFFYSSGRSSNEAGFLLQLFARIYGTNNVNNCSYYCHQATGVGLGNTIGTGTATVELDDLTHCDCFVLIGANPASNHPRLLHQLKALRDRGGKVLVINPAREPGLVRFAVPKSPGSLIAGGTEIANMYLQPRIGTDYLLLQGIARAILESGAENLAFIERHTRDFDKYKNQVMDLSWETIEQCGVNRDCIEQAAAQLSEAKNIVFAWGMGVTHHTHGVENVEQISNLALLAGMIGRTGAGLLPLRGHSNVQGIGTIGVKPVLANDIIEGLSRHFGIEVPESQGMDTMACMEAAESGGIDLALIMGGNLYASNPNSNWAEKALGAIKTKIFLTTTLNKGHLHGCEGSESLILPVTARDEEWQATTQESMFNFVRLSDGGIDRHKNTRPESWIICKLAQQALANSPLDFRAFESHQSIREAIASLMPDLSELADIEVARKEFHIKNRLLHEPVFSTPDGRAMFAPILETGLKNFTEQDSFMLSTIRSEGQFNSIVYENEDVYRGTDHRWVVMMNIEDMNQKNLKRGSRVTLKSATGVMENLEVVPFDLPRGNLMCYYPEANVVTTTAVDPRSKTPGFKSTSVNLLNE